MLPVAMTFDAVSDDTDGLVQQAAHDRRALGLLYDRYYNLIYRYCLVRLFHREAAEDVTADVFLTVARRIRSFHGSTDREFRCWVYTIAGNMTHAYIRRHLRRKYLFDAAARAGFFDRSAAPDETEPMDWPVLFQALKSLKSRDQDIVVLRFFEQLSYEDIAAIHNLETVTVRVIISRALKRLRKKLIPYFQEPKL